MTQGICRICGSTTSVIGDECLLCIRDSEVTVVRPPSHDVGVRAFAQDQRNREFLAEHR